ncbi:MAG: TIGR02996 domain-containing protein [Deltaproteobacteria bacterium]|nr:TIGR02996 domain-containing protein [Deltaproteobacteria bacterium]
MPPGFRYFELVDDRTGRYVFWEVAITGTVLELRHGPVGTPGKHERETCASESLAQHEYQLRVDAHLAEGYREVADRRLDARTRALEAAIEADLDDATSYMVYADWIETLGDARGSLINAQLAAETDPEAAPRAAAFLKQHEALFLGPLAEHVGYDGAVIEPTWRYGFIRKAKVTVREQFHPTPASVFHALLEHPSARWLDELVIATADNTSDIKALVDVLAWTARPSLRSLEIGEVGERADPARDDDPHYWRRESADLSRLWTAVRGLRRLVIKGDPERLGSLALPRLAHFEIHAQELSADDIDAIASAASPLERLELRFRWPLGPDLAESLRPIFDGPLIRGLDHLAVTGVHRTHLAGTDGVCAAIARIPRPALRTLDLSHGQMTDAGAELLAASRLDLEIVDVSKNQLSYRGVTALDRIAKLVINDH